MIHASHFTRLLSLHPDIRWRLLVVIVLVAIVLTLPPAATRPWIVSGREPDGNGTTYRSPDHRPHHHLSESLPVCRDDEDISNPFRHVVFDLYGPVNVGMPRWEEQTSKGVGVSEAAQLVKMNGIRSYESVGFLCQFTLSP